MLYHVGNLLHDREHDRKVAKIAREAWAQYLAGAITLVQRRVRPGVCEYHAIPLPRPHKPVNHRGGIRCLK